MAKAEWPGARLVPDAGESKPQRNASRPLTPAETVVLTIKVLLGISFFIALIWLIDSQLI